MTEPSQLAPGMNKPGRPMTIEGPLAELAAAVGGVNAAAGLLGCDRGVFRCWANGKRNPSSAALVAIRMVLTQHGISHGRFAADPPKGEQ